MKDFRPRGGADRGSSFNICFDLRQKQLLGMSLFYRIKKEKTRIEYKNKEKAIKKLKSKKINR